MKNKSALRVMLIVLSVLLIIVSVPVCLSAPIINYSDKEYSYYANIDGAMDVPTIFKQDTGFASDGKFPLVIKGGVEYVPLEVFIGFNGVIIEYPKETMGFYIHNKKKNMYISFDLSTGYAVLSSGGTKYLETKIFYNIIYVPLKETAAATGLLVASHIDRTQKIYCVRLYDESAQKSFGELVNEYMSRFSPTTQNDNPSKPNTPEISQKPETQTPPKTAPVTPPTNPVTPNKPEPLPEQIIGRRDLYLAFSNAPNASTEIILDMLKGWGVKAVFFCDAQNMEKYPSLLRRMIIEGHTVGICTSNKLLESSEVPVNAETVIADIQKSQSALKRLTKSSAMLYCTPPELAGDIDFDIVSAGAGVLPVSANLVCRDNTLDGNLRIANHITDYLWAMEDNEVVSQNAIVLFHSTEKTADVLFRLFDFTAPRPQIRLRRLSDAIDIDSLNLVY